ncbi:MAG: hypothetical protein A2Y14_01290 [Verrucomicrobia bacterium GWF2_51_19]|nr:MAG: hypothetical protein A2Y14_01290 [Verrucomicrobia bacterium GWF2_51_19]
MKHGIPHFLQQRSLKEKLIFPFLLFGILFITIIIGWNYLSFREELKAEISTRSRNLAQTIGIASQVVHHSYELQRLVNSLGAESDVRLILVVADTPLRVIASNKLQLVGKWIEETQIETISEILPKVIQEEQHISRMEWGKDFFTYYLSFYLPPRSGFPDVESRAGVAIQLDTTSVESNILHHAIQTTLLGIGGVVLIMVILYRILGIVVIRPIFEIKKKIEERKQGNLDARMPVSSNDEIGSLALALNQMIRAQEESEDLFLKLADIAPILLWRTDKTNTHYHFSKRFLEFTGRTSDQEVNFRWRNVIHPRWRLTFLEKYEKAFEQRAPFVLEHRIRHASGEYRWVLTRSVPRILANGSFEGYIGCMLDITERKENERKLKEYSKELAQARDEAVDSTKAKSHFLATMSHEIRTPMNGILGFLYLLQETQLDAEQKEFVRSIHSSTNILLELINQILDLSKIEAGRVELEYIPFNFHEFLQEIAELFRPMMLKKSLTFNVEIDPQCPASIEADPARLRQILINLLGNAVKFTEKGGVTLKITAHWIEENEFLIDFSVTDTGIGVHPKDWKRILEPFSQATKSTTRQYGGTGLGLSISQSLLRLMKGNLHIQSRPGEGSTFSFEIKVKGVPPVIQRTFPANEHAHLELLQNKKVLLAEDNLSNQEVTRKIFERNGIPITVVSDGESLLHELQTQDYNLILMDIRMPQLSGIEAAKRIRGGELGSHLQKIPIIAFTANAMKEDRDSCFEAGMDAFLTKPINPEELLATVHHFLTR